MRRVRGVGGGEVGRPEDGGLEGGELEGEVVPLRIRTDLSIHNIDASREEKEGERETHVVLR